MHSLRLVTVSTVAKSLLPLLWAIPALWVQASATYLQHDVIIGEPLSKGRFETLREPSGITALDSQTLMVVEDESSRALSRLTLQTSDDGAHVSFEEFKQPAAKGFIKRQIMAPLDDLEGIARVSSKQFFIIGSHENASRGAYPAREKLLLLTRDGDDIVKAALRKDLFDQLTSHYPELADIVSGSKKGNRRALNIEALAFDRKRQQLLIGLRTPLLHDNAIIVSMTNAIDYVEGAEPEFANTLHIADLDKGGIRAMAYDDLSDSLLIVSKRESGGKNRSTLWRLPATLSTAPARYKSQDKKLFQDVEGLTPIANGVLFVRDNGGVTKKGDDHWFILKRSQLGLES